MYKNIVFAILALIGMFVLASCSSESTGWIEKLPHETVLEGTHSAISEKRELKINNNDEYQKLMADVYKDLDQMPRIPEVDFNKYSVIAVFIGTRSSGGYTVSVDMVTVSDKGLNAGITETKPGKTCIVSDALTSPFVIVKFPKNDRKASFRYAQKVKECQ
jgi:PrcB C-terminal